MAFETELIDLLKSIVPAMYWGVIAGSIALVGGVIYLYFDRILDLAEASIRGRAKKKEET